MIDTTDVKDSSDPVIQADSRKILYWMSALLAVAIGGSAMMAYNENSSHWMEGWAALIMISFMPLTALTYLHYRLPKKQQEFAVIKKPFMHTMTNRKTSA